MAAQSTGLLAMTLGVMRHRVVVAALLGWLMSSPVAAAPYPDRLVRLIVPFPPGGVTDTAARVIGQHLSAKWGQQVVIENRPAAALSGSRRRRDRRRTAIPS